MKRILIAGLLALGILSLSQQQASAWCNQKFSIGLNWACQSGGNSLLWGAWRSGQPPGHDYAPMYPGHHHGHHQFPTYGAYQGEAPGQSFATVPAPTPAPAVATPPKAAPQNSAYYYRPTYQNVTFPGYEMQNPFYPANFYYYNDR
jgi:hypothetical protein